jgi:hypothetical protein
MAGSLWFMAWLKTGLIAPVMRYGARLRFPWLFAVTAVLFIFDLLIPDMVPFVDEILLGFGALLLGSVRNRNKPKLPVSEQEGDSI